MPPHIGSPTTTDRSHQQYLAKNPGGYCNIGPNGVSCPVGFADVVMGASESAKVE